MRYGLSIDMTLCESSIHFGGQLGASALRCQQEVSSWFTKAKEGTGAAEVAAGRKGSK